MMKDNLEPISPVEAKEMYLDARKREVSQSTLDGYHYRLKHFIRWCKEVEGIENMNSLSGRDLQRYKTWRRDDGDLKPISLEGQLDALRIFIRWCGSIDAVEQDLHENFEAIMPSLDKTDEQSESILGTEQAESLIEYQRKFEYASRSHVIMEILWHTGIRLGALHALDIDDYDENAERLAIYHRPKSGTPLKNGKEGERMVALNAEVCRTIEDWRDNHRHRVRDDYDRNPLLTSRNGRMNRSSIRDAVYMVTRPCYYAAECPEGRNPDDCEAAEYGGYSKCPVNVSPHDIRRGSITHFLTEDVPEKVVSDRMNVGQDVLDKHYDKRDEEVKVEQRRGYLDNI
ncbi:integrase family protein [Salinarchaeum sp. Harcht-Bsk1]|uniref:tyrosine-type recombinase/integrase n=1 Tax=Salinarchaeum sp. Harcht-Bsk1 TaxID=1333523 RepID=UPI0003423CD1|nr:tyrosine-type recombinase/integrase [Salinarchaeum sp. Harcht-Bsk1]AGN02436.1 integrase family protein [Salinarchaeum sp. Harcht-Bsk1]